MGYWKRRLLDFLSTPACAVCRTELPREESRPICGRCFSVLVPRIQCRRSPDGLEVWAAFANGPAFQELLQAFKYKGHLSVGEFLGVRMGSLLASLPQERIDAVVPVPMHSAKARRRGFDQAAILARCVAAAARSPKVDLLERAKNTPPQWRLDRTERASNVSEAFRVRPKPAADLSPEAGILLIDDVSATGATLDDCARALRQAGFRRVRGYVLTFGAGTPPGPSP